MTLTKLAGYRGGGGGRERERGKAGGGGAVEYFGSSENDATRVRYRVSKLSPNYDDNRSLLARLHDVRERSMRAYARKCVKSVKERKKRDEQFASYRRRKTGRALREKMYKK